MSDQLPADPGKDLLLTGIGELVTNDPSHGGLLGIVPDAAVAVSDGVIDWVGAASATPDEARNRPTVDVEGRAVLPGFVDAHTHVVFAGDRADEFARRLGGETYEEVLASGGGILSTVRATRAADEDRLVTETVPRLDRMLAAGTTTAEAKSGYGLDVDTERRTLAVTRALDEVHPIDLVPTFLGAHLVPEEHRGDPDGYVDFVVSETLPACAPLARFGDVFCDEGAFTVDQSRRVLQACRDAGLALRVHANELARSGGALLAAELGATSADHLAHVDETDARALADAGVVAVLLPATTFSLRTHHYAPGRLLWDAGVTVALGTDCNPGTSWTESMPFVIALACLEGGLTPDEAVWAATAGSARSLRVDDRGVVASGRIGDLVVLDAPTHRHLPYRAGCDLVHLTVKRGEVVGKSPHVKEGVS